MAVKVLFVCLGNICRSPTAHAVFQSQVDQAGLGNRIQVDSAGTGEWHLGKPPDKRSSSVASMRGYDMSSLRARQVSSGDFEEFDYILAMDNTNLADLQSMEPTGYQGILDLFLSFDKQSDFTEVPDPYYGGTDGFDRVLDLVEAAASNLLAHIEERLD
jgi:protein-tyrosine phosphatase